MTTVIGIRFKKAGKVYYFDPSEVWPNPGDNVIVETARGVELGEVVTGAREVDEEQIVAPLKKVLRLAVPDDLRRVEMNEAREKEAFAVCQERIEQHKLEMKLVDVEYTFDGSKIIFYFTANGRVDFRELVKDLASVFRMRIELRQIGVRDEAKMIGGLGPCGRHICCAAFLGDFQPVSIKMAKEQNLSLNPTKISGQCGRLMCCLKYESDYYEATLKRLPKVGKEAMTPDGIGIVSEINVIREKIRVRVRMPDDTYDLREYDMNDVLKPGAVPNAPRADADIDADASDAVPDEDVPETDAPNEDRPQEAAAPVPDRRPQRLVRRPRPDEAGKAQDAPAEGGKKPPRPPRPIRPKAPKQASTDEYFENLAKQQPVAPDPDQQETPDAPPQE